MYIVAIGWLYVVLLMALAETGFVAGAATLLFYGLIPVCILLWLGGTRTRRQRSSLADQRARQSDGTNPEADQ